MGIWEVLSASILLVIGFAGSGYIGFRIGRMIHAPLVQSGQAAPREELTPEEQLRREKFGKSFGEMMTYDVSTALASKKARLTDGD